MWRQVFDVRLMGSTLVLVLGWASFAGGLSRPGAGLVSGPCMILCALAYRSARRRQLGRRLHTGVRIFAEWVALAVAMLAVVLQNDLAARVATEPLPNLVIPAWGFIAYVVMAMRAEMSERAVME